MCLCRRLSLAILVCLSTITYVRWYMVDPSLELETDVPMSTKFIV
jgi:hypothetical protein